MINSGSLSIAIVDEELPYPPTSGKRIRTLNLLKCLANRHRITILSHRNRDADEAEAATDYLAEHGIATRFADCPTPTQSVLSGGPSLYAKLFRNLFSSRPYVVDANFSASLKQLIHNHATLYPTDVWQFEWTPYAALADSEMLRRSIVVAHNVESLIWQRYYETELNPAIRWYIYSQWKKFERFERTILTRAQCAVAVSDADAALIGSRFGREKVDVVENGVDLDFFRPESRQLESPAILFLGSLDWRPNLDAVKWLLDTLFPRLLAVRPRTRLAIVGRKPPRWLVDCVGRQRSVDLHADVPDVRPHLAVATAMVVPLRIGGGTRLKILEAAAAGVPVVSTAVGAEGLSLAPGEHYVQADSPEQMVAALIHILDDPTSAADMADRAYRHVSAHYGWPSLATKLEQIWLTCSLSFDRALAGTGLALPSAT